MTCVEWKCVVPDHDKLILMGLQQWVDPHTSFDVEFYTGRPLTQPSQGFVSPLSVEAGIFSLLRLYINHYSLYGAIFYFT